MKKLLLVLSIALQFQSPAQKLDHGTVFDFRQRIFPRKIVDLGSDRLLITGGVYGKAFSLVNGRKSNGLVLTDYEGNIIDPAFGNEIIQGGVLNVKANLGYVFVSTGSKIFVLNMDGEKITDSDILRSESPFQQSIGSIHDINLDKSGNYYFTASDYPNYSVFKRSSNGDYSKVSNGTDWVTIYTSADSDQILLLGSDSLKLIDSNGVEVHRIKKPSYWVDILNYGKSIEFASDDRTYFKYGMDGSLQKTFAFPYSVHYGFYIYEGESIVVNTYSSLERYSLSTGEKIGEFAHYNYGGECHTGVALETGQIVFSGTFGYIDGLFAPGIAFLDSNEKVQENKIKLQSETYPNFMLKVGESIVSGGDFYGYGNRTTAGLVVTSPSGTFVSSLKMTSQLTNRVCGLTLWNSSICVSRPCEFGCGDPDIQMYDSSLNAIDSLEYSSAGSIEADGDFLIQQGAWEVNNTWYPLSKTSEKGVRSYAPASYVNSASATRQVMAVKDDWVYRVGSSPEGIHALCINSLDFTEEHKISFTNSRESSGSIVEVFDGVILPVSNKLYKVKGLEIDAVFRSPVFPNNYNESVYTLAHDKGLVYVGGGFHSVNDIDYPGIVAISETTGDVIDSIAFPLEIGSIIQNIVVFGTDIYVGGDLILKEGKTVKFARFSLDPNFVDSEITVDVEDDKEGELETVLAAKPHESISVFPNPTGGAFSLRIPESQQGTYRIFNLSGAEINSGKLSSDHLQVPGPDGVYVLRIQLSDGATKEFRIVKAR